MDPRGLATDWPDGRVGKENAWGSMGIWFGLLAGLSASSIMLYIRFNYLSKKLIERGVIKDLL